MRSQLFPALIGFVNGIEEGDWIRNVNQYGQTKLACGVPDRNQSGVIYLRQLPKMILDMQSKGLPDFESLSACLLLGLKSAYGPIDEAVAHTLPLGPVHATEDLKSLRCLFFEVPQVLVEKSFAPAAIQVHIMYDACSIQSVEQFAERLLVPATAEGFSQMIVGVDYWKLGLVYQGGLGHKFRLRAKVLKLHRCLFSAGRAPDPRPHLKDSWRLQRERRISRRLRFRHGHVRPCESSLKATFLPAIGAG